jgi:hypothetical protein
VSRAGGLNGEAVQLVRGLLAQKQRLERELAAVNEAFGRLRALAGLDVQTCARRAGGRPKQARPRAAACVPAPAKPVKAAAPPAPPARKAAPRPARAPRPTPSAPAPGPSADELRRAAIRTAAEARLAARVTARPSQPEPEPEEDDVSAIDDLEDDFHPAAAKPPEVARGPRGAHAIPPAKRVSRRRVPPPGARSAAQPVMPPRELVRCRRCKTTVLRKDEELRGHLARAHGGIPAAQDPAPLFEPAAAPAKAAG